MSRGTNNNYFLSVLELDEFKVNQRHIYFYDISQESNRIRFEILRLSFTMLYIFNYKNYLNLFLEFYTPNQQEIVSINNGLIY